MITKILATCLLAGGLTVASVTTADDTKADTSNSAATASNHQKNGGQKRVDAQIDRLSKKVDLTSDQKDKLRSQLTKSNQSTQKLWQQFANSHVQVIRLEAEMTAALEDVLEPEQQMQTQKNRQAKASSDSHKAAPAGKSGTAPASASAKKPVKNGSSTSNKSSSQAKSSATDNQSDTKKRSDTKKTDKSSASRSDSKSAANKDSDDDQDETEEYVWTMVIVPVQEELNPLGLSAEQELQADQIFANYHNKIVKGWQKIDQLHDQLVAIEAQSVLDVEKVLTKDQRQKLMDTRKNSKTKGDSSKSKSKS